MFDEKPAWITDTYKVGCNPSKVPTICRERFISNREQGILMQLRLAAQLILLVIVECRDKDGETTRKTG
jgi:hypothetical protein